MLRNANNRQRARGVFVKERVTIQVPTDVLFAFWRHVDNLSRVMPFLPRVEITNEVPDELIAWRSLPGADVTSAGSVLFKPAGPHGTRMTVVLQCAPAGGRVGAWIAALLGRSPEIEIRQALCGLKQTMESGGFTPALTHA